MKTKAAKQADLERLRADLVGARHAFVVGFTGLKVVDCDALRKKVREARGRYRVVKNTLARRASAGTSLESLAAQFTGPTALIEAPRDPAAVAKVLTEFAKGHPSVTVKAGLVDGVALTAAECKVIADLPPRERLLAQLAGVLQAPLQRLATVLAAPPRDLAVVLGQVAGKKND
jgi:large subunit ribosomal protein L10